MNRVMKKVTHAVLLCLVSISSSLAQQAGLSYAERELDYLMQIWPGDYDNQEQISFDAVSSGEEQIADSRFHAYIKRIEIPELGEHVLFSEETREGLGSGSDSKLFQQRVYVLSAEDGARAVRVKSYQFKKTRDLAGYQRDPSELQKISNQDVSLLAGCDFLFRRDREGFVGMLESVCNHGDTSRSIQRELVVSRNEYSFKQRVVSSAGEVLSSIAAYQPRVMKRARWFVCMIDVPKTKPEVSNYTQHYMRIHDQGGTFSFVHPDGRDMTLLMRNTWSYGMQRETFFIGVLEGDVDGNTLVYSWGMPGADRIGMNPGWIRVQCDLDSERNIKLQNGLRAES